MRRGDVVAVAAAGDYGKPRPAVIVQTDAFPDDHPLHHCLPDDIEPRRGSGFSHCARAEHGKRAANPLADHGGQAGDGPAQHIGRLANADMARLNSALAFVMGLAD